MMEVHHNQLKELKLKLDSIQQLETAFTHGYSKHPT